MTISNSNPSQDNPMTFTITPNTSVASLAQHIIDNHSRQKAATLLADLYNKTWDYMETAIQSSDWDEAKEQSIKLVDLVTITKAYDIHRDMHVAVLKTMPYRG